MCRTGFGFGFGFGFIETYSEKFVLSLKRDFGFFFSDRVLLGTPETQCVDQVGLKLMEIHLPQLSDCWESGVYQTSDF